MSDAYGSGALGTPTTDFVLLQTAKFPPPLLAAPKERLAKSMGEALAMRWPKEEGTDFAGHEMAKGGFAGHRMTKKSDPTTWPKGEGCGNFFFPHLPPLPFWSGGECFLDVFPEKLSAN